MTAVPRLIGTGYRAPRCRVGKPLFCILCGDRTVDGLTDTPVPWPYHKGYGSTRSLFLTGDLIRAIRTESAQAVAYHWGVSRATVRRWRWTLRVPRFTAGTVELWRDLRPKRLNADAIRRGGLAAAKARKWRPSNPV